jgi:hypothetical protein
MFDICELLPPFEFKFSPTPLVDRFIDRKFCELPPRVDVEELLTPLVDKPGCEAVKPTLKFEFIGDTFQLVTLERAK